MKSKKSDFIVSRIRAEILDGTRVPKPKAESYEIKGWGFRRKEPALVYFIPNRRKPENPWEKGITETEFVEAYDRLCEAGEFTRKWFNISIPKCAKEGGCNFTTIGGIFDLLGEASYSGKGVYERKLHT